MVRDSMPVTRSDQLDTSLESGGERNASLEEADADAQSIIVSEEPVSILDSIIVMDETPQGDGSSEGGDTNSDAGQEGLSSMMQNLQLQEEALRTSDGAAEEVYNCLECCSLISGC